MAHGCATFRQLQYFLAVADTLNFHRAATQLKISQPTLTNQMLALEESLKIQLFERSRAGTKVTPAGRELLSTAKRVVEEFQEFHDRAAMLTTGPGGIYKFGVTATLAPYLLPRILPHIHRCYGSLKFHVREQAPRELEAGLIDGEHDFILTPLPVSESKLTVRPLFQEPLRLVVSADHRLAGKKVIHEKDLADESVLTLEEHHHFYHQVKALCERLNAQILDEYVGTSLETLRQMIVMGMGVAFLPALYVLSEIHRPRELRIKDLRGKPIFRTHALAWRKASPRSPVFETLAADIQKFTGQYFGEEIKLLPLPRRVMARAPK